MFFTCRIVLLQEAKGQNSTPLKTLNEQSQAADKEFSLDTCDRVVKEGLISLGDQVKWSSSCGFTYFIVSTTMCEENPGLDNTETPEQQCINAELPLSIGPDCPSLLSLSSLPPEGTCTSCWAPHIQHLETFPLHFFPVKK